MLGAWTNLLFLECERSRLPSESGINAASIAELVPGLAASPDRGVMSVAVTTLGTNVVDVRLFRAMSVIVRVDELLGSEFVSLLKVKSTRVAEWL